MTVRKRIKSGKAGGISDQIQPIYRQQKAFGFGRSSEDHYGSIVKDDEDEFSAWKVDGKQHGHLRLQLKSH